MSKGIGEIILRLRKEAGLSQGQVCKGLCSTAQFMRMEQNQTAVDHFLLDRFFGRMGKSTERLEYVLTADAYELYEMQYLIQRSICYRKFDEAETLLQKYERKKKADKPLHRQFIEQERAQIAWIQGKEMEEVLMHLQSAIAQTMPLEEMLREDTAFCAEEIKLLLFRWEICLGTKWERPRTELVELLEYMSWRKLADTEAVRVYPYAVMLLRKGSDWKKEVDVLEFCTRKALHVLRETGKILFMPEMLEQYADILEYRYSEDEKVKMLRAERDSLLTIEKEYGIYFENYRLYQHLNRRFEVDYEMLRRTRLAKGIPQEELCEGICTQEELSRIEMGKRRPRDKNLHDLTERMERGRRRVGMVITTDEYEILELKRKYFMKLLKFEFGGAKALLDVIAEKLDGSLQGNQQFILGERAKMFYENKERDWQECMGLLKEALGMTLDYEGDEAGRLVFTAEEHCILNEMSVIYYENQEEEKAIQILESQIQNMEDSYVSPIFHLLEWELAVGNLATAFVENGKPLRAFEICKDKIRIALEAGKGNDIGRSLITQAYALEQRKNAECVEFFTRGLEFFKLYNNRSRYRYVYEHVTGSEFMFKEQFNHYRG